MLFFYIVLCVNRFASVLKLTPSTARYNFVVSSPLLFLWSKSYHITNRFTLGRCQKFPSSCFRRHYIFDPILEKKGFSLMESKNNIVSKNNILLFFITYIHAADDICGFAYTETKTMQVHKFFKYIQLD